MNACVVGLLWFTLFPLYHSRDDVFVLYLSGGGFGKEPSAFLHFNHLMNPVLGLLLQKLFQLAPSFNWYSLLLVFAQYICWTAFFYFMLKQFKIRTAFLFYMLLVLIFGTVFLLSVNFTITAAFCALTACSFYLSGYLEGKSWKIHLIPVAFLVAGSFFRMHALIPVLLVLSPFFIRYKSRQMNRALLRSFAIASAIILLFHLFHVQYYRTVSAEWQQEEKYRQELFKYVNQPRKLFTDKDSQLEARMMQQMLFVDPEFLNTDVIREVRSRQLPTLKSRVQNIRPSIYWLFMENRIYLCCILILAFFILPGLKKGILLKFLFSVFVALGLIAGLSLFQKLPVYLFPLISITLAYALVFVCTQADFLRNRKSVFLLSISFLFVWAAFRTARMNTVNLAIHQRFENIYKQFAQHPEFIFYASGSDYPLEGFSAKSAPVDYPITNVLFSGIFVHGEVRTILQKYRIPSVGDLWKDNRLLFWSDSSATNPSEFDLVFSAYCLRRLNLQVEFLPVQQEGGVGSFRKLRTSIRP